MSLNPSRDPLSSFLATGTRLKDWMRAIYRVHLKAVHSIRIHLDRKFVVGRRSRCVGVRAVILTPKGNKTMEHTATIDIFSNASRLPPLLHPSARTGTSRDEWFASQGCPWPSPTTRFFFFFQPNKIYLNFLEIIARFEFALLTKIPRRLDDFSLTLGLRKQIFRQNLRTYT